jgi:hypothetical protein
MDTSIDTDIRTRCTQQNGLANYHISSILKDVCRDHIAVNDSHDRVIGL